MTDEELRDKLASERLEVYGSPDGTLAKHEFLVGWNAARANPDPRVEKLVQTGKLAIAAMKGSGNFAQAILAVENFSAALAEWEKGE